MRIHRHAVTLAAGVLVSAAAPTLYAQTSRFAVVDLQRALAETEDGRRAIRRLKQLTKRNQADIDERTEALKKAQERLEKRRPALSEEAFAREAAELQKQYVALQQKYVEYQRELAETEQRLSRPILSRLSRIVRRMGQADGYTFVLERTQGGVVWAPSNLDLTDSVIQRYNAGEGRDGEPQARSERRRRRRRGGGAGAREASD